eukprot:TRINITY_DN12611_c0_g1_i1.p1 TRINITY_DN12611_c0_g1~~TRINITY_DN12611_c0_g1_i1.p1  ORF type:complete len:149 (+),score=10.66 TRINITY_DN12611_c0_g1_i1:44-490(+)
MSKLWEDLVHTRNTELLQRSRVRLSDSQRWVSPEEKKTEKAEVGISPLVGLYRRRSYVMSPREWEHPQARHGSLYHTQNALLRVTPKGQMEVSENGTNLWYSVTALSWAAPSTYVTSEGCRWSVQFNPSGTEAALLYDHVTKVMWYRV